MGKAGRIFGKMMQGAASVAVPAALAEQAARIQAKRDEKLQGYAQQNMQANQTYQSAENAANREFTASENAASRDLQQQQIDLSEMKLDLEGPEREKRLELLSSQIEGSKLQNRGLTVAADDAEAVRDLFSIMQDDKASDEERSAATELYLMKVPAARRKVIVKQLQDKFGNYTNDFAVFDADTGNRRDGAGSPGGALPWKDGAALKKAFSDGEIPAAEAENWYSIYKSRGLL